jgi:hypothetical protein
VTMMRPLLRALRKPLLTWPAGLINTWNEVKHELAIVALHTISSWQDMLYLHTSVRNQCDFRRCLNLFSYMCWLLLLLRLNYVYLQSSCDCFFLAAYFCGTSTLLIYAYLPLNWSFSWINWLFRLETIHIFNFIYLFRANI